MSEVLVLSIGALSAQTGVPEATLRTWERRYGFPDPARSATGRREYGLEAVRQVQMVAQLLALGHKARHVLSLSDEGRRVLLGTPQAERVVVAPEGWLDAVVRSDASGLHASVVAALARHGLRDFAVVLVPPFLTELGLAWADGRVRVDQEHLASEVLTDVLGAAWRLLAATGPQVVLGALPGERHAMGLQVCAAVFALAGWGVHYLGADAPVRDLVAAVKDAKAKALAISVALGADQAAVVRDLAFLRGTLTGSVTVLCGGAGAPAVEGVTLLSDLAALEAWAEQHR